MEEIYNDNDDDDNNNIISITTCIYVVIAAIIIWFLYLKIRYPFWGSQPVLHTYDWRARLFQKQPRIIETKVTPNIIHEQNTTVFSLPHDECSLVTKKEICRLIVAYYIPSDRITYCMTPALFDVYFRGSFRRPIVTMWREPTTFSQLAKNTSYKIVGCICSRGIYVRLGEAETSVEGFYFDWLTFRPTASPKGSLIQTQTQKMFEIHEWRQRRLTLQTYVSAFRRDNNIMGEGGEGCAGVIPMVSFAQSMYYLPLVYRQNNDKTSEQNENPAQTKLDRLPQNFRIRRIETDDNIHFLQDFMETLHMGRQHAAAIFAPLPALFEWIKERQLMVCALQQYDHLYALYFFRHANLKYDDLESTGANDVLHLVASYSNMVLMKDIADGEQKADAMFYLGFQHALHSVVTEKRTTRSIHLSPSDKKQRKGQRSSSSSSLMDGKYGLLSVDEIGHNTKLIPYWEQSCSPLWRTASAYFLYNYECAAMPYAKEDCFVLL